MPVQKPSETWSPKMAVVQACGLGVFAGGYVGLQAGWKPGIGAAIVTAMAVLTFTWVMRMREAKRQQKSN
jgi:Flp pilus assembly protein TadB